MRYLEPTPSSLWKRGENCEKARLLCKNRKRKRTQGCASLGSASRQWRLLGTRRQGYDDLHLKGWSGRKQQVVGNNPLLWALSWTFYRGNWCLKGGDPISRLTHLIMGGSCRSWRFPNSHPEWHNSQSNVDNATVQVPQPHCLAQHSRPIWATKTEMTADLLQERIKRPWMY